MSNLPGLVGVILCGGNSSRMGTDKSLIEYHGKPQRYFLYDLITPFCNQVFISCNKFQSEKILDSYLYIEDQKEFSEHGPVSGLLSVFSKYSEHSILLIGCDYPYINENAIKQLVKSRTSQSDAVCFRNDSQPIPEPLLTIYESKSYRLLLDRFHQNEYSLKIFLQSLNTTYILPSEINILKSIDNPDEYKSWIDKN